VSIESIQEQGIELTPTIERVMPILEHNVLHAVESAVLQHA
jgi:hypothetical protein